MTAGLELAVRPQAVIFDMDGLMLDSERALLGCLAQAGAEAGHDLPQAFLLSLIGSSDALTRQRIAGQIGADAVDGLLRASYARYDVLVAAGVPHRPGIVELLELLAAHGVPRAVATSTRRPLALRKLESAGLLGYFEHVATSSDVAHPKPAPDIYLLAARSLGVDPRHCLALEDSPTGVRAALAAGMTVVQVPDLLEPDAGVRALGHAIAGSLHDVRGLLQPLLSA
ncbi:HAD family hydrolase [Stenotrophomonas mori]|uniref:HAD family phosphatase n=1 Tax=Stenotrophomonas mori TaxID=2871096 RepID=A0ABT0SIZ2_9GAMM|nr:HAD family phosphatase [Stenotrophomonas mori]MCL7715293.1 HAD family phosphatase [Stenotrophomonas mori]